MKIFIKPILAVIIFCIMQLLAGMVFTLFSSTPQDAILNRPGLFATSIMVSGILTVGILYWMHMFSPRTFDPRRVNWNYAYLGIIGVLLGILVVDLLSEKLKLPDLMQLEFIGLSQNRLGVLAIAIVGPIVEEVVFRASVLGYMLRHEVGQWTAIAVSAILFGLVHFNPAQIPAAIIIGMLLGIIYVKSHSVILTSIIHIINNSLAVYEMRVFGGLIKDFSLTNIMGESLAELYILVCALLCFVFLRDYMKKYHRIKNIHKHHHHHHH